MPFFSSIFKPVLFSSLALLSIGLPLSYLRAKAKSKEAKVQTKAQKKIIALTGNC